MEAFVWDQRFATGIEIVDQQHHHLVDIVNEVGDLLLKGDQVSEGKLQIYFKQLADYARQHFADEERLMRETGLDSRHVKGHTDHHHQFVQQVASMWRGRGSMKLGALHKLYGLLSAQNQDLAEANIRLEDKVAERTQALTEANQRLATEQRELTELLRKVEEAQSQLLQSEKMAAIGQLAAGVAHEINNPIGFVNSNLGTLKGYVERLLTVIGAYDAALADPGTPAERYGEIRRQADLDFLQEDVVSLLDESREGLARVKKIVQDLKDFSHVDQAEWQEADINAGLESTLNVVWSELKYKADVVREYGTLPPVYCLAAQLNQVFMNLLVNAAQAIEQHGTITVRSGLDGPYVWVEIQDTGKGMPPEVSRRIFEPFFTTKPVGKGTGLGLSLSYDIVVKRHGGRIDVSSQPGQGSTFRVWLPVAGPQIPS